MFVFSPCPLRCRLVDDLQLTKPAEIPLFEADIVTRFALANSVNSQHRFTVFWDTRWDGPTQLSLRIVRDLHLAVGLAVKQAMYSQLLREAL